MSAIDLAVIKRDLRVTHDADDVLLQELLDAAEVEARRFLDRDALPLMGELDSEEVSSDAGLVEPDVRVAVTLLVRSKYDAATALEIGHLRQGAETLLMPYRQGLGV